MCTHNYKCNISNARRRLVRDKKRGEYRGREYRNEYADTGEGISEESRGRIFEPLFTTKSRSVDLGVALCRRYVEVHGGEIEVESEVGKGVRLL